MRGRRRRRRTSELGRRSAAGRRGDRHLRRTPSRARPTTSPTSTSTPGSRRPPACRVPGPRDLLRGGLRPPYASTPGRGGLAGCRASAGVATSTPGPRARRRPRGAALLADGPPRPLPAVGRRRRGLVLADLDLDGARLLRRAAARRGATPGCPPATPTRGSTTPRAMTYDHAYDGTGNWPFNTAYAAPPRRPRVRHPAARPARGRAASSPPASRWSRRSRSARASSTAPRSRSSDGHLAGDRRLHRHRQRGRQRPGRRRRPAVRRTYDRGQFEDAWLPSLRRHRLRDHRRRPPAPAWCATNW